MRCRLMACSAAVVSMALAGPAFAGVVVDFEDLGPGTGPVPAGYGGIASWGSWTYFDDPQDPYNPSSGVERIFDSFNNPTPIEFGADYIFEGAWFAGFDAIAGGGDIVIDLYNDNAVVHTTAVIAPNAVPTFHASGYAGTVDEVRMRAVAGDYGFFIMDDFTYQIPAPGALALLGVAGVAARRRRRAA